MSFNYSGDPAASERDTVRFLLADTDQAEALFSDEEIAYAVALVGPVYGDHHMTAAYLADVAASRYAGETAISADGVTTDLGDLAEKYRELGVRLRQMHAELTGAGAGPIDLSSLPGWAELGIPPKVFGLRMLDNTAVGRQDYGSARAQEWLEPAAGLWTGS